VITLPANEAVRGAILVLCVVIGFVLVRLFSRKIAGRLPAFGAQPSRDELQAVLEAILADPTTTAKDRASAERRLAIHRRNIRSSEANGHS